MNNLKIKKRISKKTLALGRTIFFIAFGYALVYPFLFLLSRSVMGIVDYYDPTVSWFPKSFHLENFITAFKAMNFKSSFVVTVLYEIVAALIQFCSCCVAAYGISRFNFKGKKILTAAMFLTILVPSAMIITPSYVNFSRMDFLGILGGISKLTGKELRPNLIDTPLVFYLPSLLGVGLKGGFFVYIFSQFFKGLPKELEEAAWIDGAGPWRTFLSIVVPSSGAASVTVLLFSIVWHWNDYYLSGMYLDSNNTLSSALYSLGPIDVSQAGVDISITNAMTGYITAAAGLTFIIPMIILYVVIQRKFIASIATSGIVG